MSNELLIEGIDDLLENYIKKGCKLRIVTLNTRENSWITLKYLGIGQYFDGYF